MGKLDVVYEKHKEKRWEKNGFEYRLIDRITARDMMLNNHYSKKWNVGHFGYVNVGIFKDGVLYGAAVYGHLNNPKSALKLAQGLTSIDEVLELNRMWVDDYLGMNTESQLISMSFKIIKECVKECKIIQTFADGRLGVGTIYKASGFSYYGKTKTWFVRDTKTQEMFHSVNTNNYARPNGIIRSWKPILDNTWEVFEVYTYRYLFFLHRKVKKYCNFKEQVFPVYHKGELPFELVWPKENAQNKIIKCFRDKGEHEYVEKFILETKRREYE